MKDARRVIGDSLKNVRRGIPKVDSAGAKSATAAAAGNAGLCRYFWGCGSTGQRPNLDMRWPELDHRFLRPIAALSGPSECAALYQRLVEQQSLVQRIASFAAIAIKADQTQTLQARQDHSIQRGQRLALEGTLGGGPQAGLNEQALAAGL